MAPPYRYVDLIDPSRLGKAPPPGAVVFGHGPNTLGVLAGLTQLFNRWPWVVPCVEISGEDVAVEPLLMLVSELRDSLAVARRQHQARSLEPTAVLGAVRNRKALDAETLSRWFGRRVVGTELGHAVAQQFKHALDGPPMCETVSPSTLSRLFARFGPYTARDWRAIARLCGHCSTSWSRDGMYRLPRRTAHQYAKKYVQLPYRSLSERVGWEWVLECALRAGRYVTMPA